MYVDYRALNKNVIINAYPIPYTKNILDCLGGSIMLNKIDLVQGYSQAQIAEGHEHRTVFQMPFRLFEYHVLPFGLCNAPETL